MSYWTYINGTITVSPMGRTQPEKRYILDTVLSHLPRVMGSEGDMDVYVMQKNGHNNLYSCDEFGEVTNNLTDYYGNKSRKRGWFETQDDYILVVDGALRDREFDHTYREFMKWIVRLGKRIEIKNILVEVKGYDRYSIIKNEYVQNRKYLYQNVFSNLFENPSWCNETGEPTWTEYLMWDRAKNSNFPMILGYKYFSDEENDKEAERRLNYNR